MVDEDFLGTFIDATDLVPVHPWRRFEGGGKGEVSGAPDAVGDIARSEVDIAKGDI